ncbi:hypothetical protein ACGF0J_28045 [Nonomuraea sp. NPDC047897]|uniref:hypothetical protein n=1 Tax=Nonomuraea sp. NPDC047897 TaxID=3364346 RepID=UPI003721D908
MADQVWMEEMRQVLDEAFRDRDRVAVRDVYSCASERIRLTADMLAHLNELPEGDYTRQEMTGEINRVIRDRGEQDTLGLLESPARIEAVEDTAEAERAVWDDTPLEALNPTPGPPQEGSPDFREAAPPAPERGDK